MNGDEMAAKEMVGQASKLWWVWVLTGVVWVIVALVILQFHAASLTTVGVLIGIFFLVAGIQEFLMAWLAEGWRWLWALFGVLFMIAGIVALAYPKNTVGSIANVLGFLFLLVGIFWIIESLATRTDNELWWLTLIAGILMIILAFWTGAQFLTTKVYTLLAFTGIWLLLHGITDIIKAFQIKKLGRMIAG